MPDKTLIERVLSQVQKSESLQKTWGTGITQIAIRLEADLLEVYKLIWADAYKNQPKRRSNDYRNRNYNI